MMKNKKASVKSNNSSRPPSVLDSNLSESTGHSSWLSQQLLSYYKQKCIKLEKDHAELLEIIEDVKSACDLSNQLQLELRLRDEEVSKLQHLIGDLQIHLFQEREQNLKLAGENDKLKIQNYENQKKINLLLLVNGATEKKICHYLKADLEGNLVESRLPLKLKKLKEEKQKQITKHMNLVSECSNEGNDDLKLMRLKNESLTSQLEQHMKISQKQIEVLIKEKELLKEEKITEIQKILKQVDLLSDKFKESQDLLCATTKKLVSSQYSHEREKTLWMEEKDKHIKTINFLKMKFGEDIPDIGDYNGNSVHLLTRFCSENEVMRKKMLEKEKLAASYQEKMLTLQDEICRLREKAETSRKIFKEKTEKMTSQVEYLKKKYEDLNTRRYLEAEGFHTDIKMLRERLKAVEKKIGKASSGFRGNEQQQLLVSAKNTLNRAKLLERELDSMKSRIYGLESNTDHSVL